MTATRWTAAENVAFRYALVDPTNPNTTMNQPGPNGTDIGNSIDIGAARANSSLWVFGDTFWHQTGTTRGTGLRLVRNPVGLQTGRDLSTSTFRMYTGGSDTAPIDFFPPISANGTEMWKYPLGGILLDDRVLVVGMLTASVSGQYAQFGTSMAGSWATMLFDLSNNDPRQWTQLNVPVNMPTDQYTRAPNYAFGCNPIDAGDGYVYFYCFGARGSDRWAVCRALRTEVKAANLQNLLWWDGSTGWKRDPRNHQKGTLRRQRYNVVNAGFGDNDQPGGVHKRPDGQWQFTYTEDGGWRQAVNAVDPTGFPYPLRYMLGAGPPGKFSTPTTLGTLPIVHTGNFVYGAFSLPEQTWSGKGALDQLIVYSRNGGGLSLFTDSTKYWPELVKVTGIA